MKTALLLALALTAQGDRPSVERGQWVEGQRDAAGVAYIDVASVQGSGDARLIWLRVDYATASENTGDSRTFFLMEVNCDRRTMALARYVGYDREGQLTSDGAIPPGERDPGGVEPDTMSAQVYARACGRP